MRNSRMKQVRTLALVVIPGMWLLMLYGCGGGFDKPTDVPSSGGTVTITAPKGWSTQTELNAEADIQIANIWKDMYLIVLSEPKSDFPEDMDYLAHSELTRGEIMKALTNASQDEGPNNLDFEGRKAVEYQISGQVEGTDIVYLHTTIDDRSMYHQVLAWTTPARFDEAKATLRTAARSVSQTGGN